MNHINVVNKPNFAIFLEVTGVLNYGDKTYDLAQEHRFHSPAIECFKELIERMDNLAKVHIVVSSGLRIGRTLEQLKGFFQMHNLSEYVHDKTSEVKEGDFRNWSLHCSHQHMDLDDVPLSQLERAAQHGENLNITLCRASQINKWYHSHAGYKGFIVIDAEDDHLTINFGDSFISTKSSDGVSILQKEHADRAFQNFLSQLNSQPDSDEEDQFLKGSLSKRF